jgi:hypothetical protein
VVNSSGVVKTMPLASQAHGPTGDSSSEPPNVLQNAAKFGIQAGQRTVTCA